MKKRILNYGAVFMMVFLLLSLISVMASATEYDTSVFVGGIELNNGNYLASSSMTVVTTKPSSGGYAYYNNGTLTLNNYSYSGTENVDSGIIYSEGDMSLVLVGENAIVASSDTYEQSGIYCVGNLSVSGTGSLTLSASEDGFYSDGDISIDDVTIIFTNCYDGFHCAGELTIRNADITVENAIDDGFYAGESMIIIDCSIVVENALGDGLHSESDMVIIRGLVDVVFADDNGLESAEKAIEITESNIDVVSSSHCLFANVGVRCTDSNIVVESELGDGLSGESYIGTYCSSILITSAYDGLKSAEEVEISESDITVEFAENDGLVTGVNMLISDSAVVVEEALNHGVVAGEGVIITNSSISVYGSYGICAFNNLIVRCSTANVTAQYTGLSCSDSTLNIIDSKVDVSSNTCAIYAYNVSITAGSKVNAVGEYQGITAENNIDIIDSNLSAISSNSEDDDSSSAIMSESGTVTFAPALNVQAAVYPDGQLGMYFAKNLNKYDFIKINIVTVATPELIVTNRASDGKPILKWNAVNGAVKYEIYRATSKNGAYKLLTTTKGTTVTNTSALAGISYYYTVRAIDSNGVPGKYSTIINRMCDCAQPVVTVTNRASDGKPVVKWQAVTGAVKYEIYRATSKSGTYTKLITTTGTSFVNTSAVTGKTYYYKVRALGSSSSATSAYSAIVNRMCDCAQPVVTVTNRASDGKPVIKWQAVTGAVKYEIYRATSKSGTYTKLITTTGTSLVNTSAVAGKTYYYKVRALGSSSSATSAYSAIVNRMCDCAQPVVTVTNRASDGKPVIKWQAVTGAVKYEIYRATSKSGTYTKLITTTGTSLVNTSAVAGKTYYYKVRALGSSSSATSAYSSVVSIKAK